MVSEGILNIYRKGKLKSTTRLSKAFRTLCQSLILTPRLSDKILNVGKLMGHFRPAPNDSLMSARATGE